MRGDFVKRADCEFEAQVAQFLANVEFVKWYRGAWELPRGARGAWSDPAQATVVG